MLTFEKFSGINNAQPAHRLSNDALTVATNVNIGLSGEVSRRSGYAEMLDTCHKNLHQAQGFLLATVDGGDLMAMDASGGSRVMVCESLGPSRVWYCNLPDGRVTFSNGAICGITDGVTTTGWGVSVPDSVGEATGLSGALDPGDYIHSITYVRQSDGLESESATSTPITLTDGGVMISGLPALDGYSINVYLSSANGEGEWLAGNTVNTLFAYTGSNSSLILPKRTGSRYPAPAGRYASFWRGRVLVAVGNVLYASRPHAWEAFDLQRDFKQFSAPITLVQPVDGGVFVGTERELAFLSGTSFDALSHSRVMDAPVIPGSGVQVPGEYVQRGDGVGNGVCTICIAGGELVAGFADGGVARMTGGRFKTDASEVASTFRIVNGIPQYIAVPQ